MGKIIYFEYNGEVIAFITDEDNVKGAKLESYVNTALKTGIVNIDNPVYADAVVRILELLGAKAKIESVNIGIVLDAKNMVQAFRSDPECLNFN